MEKNNVLNSELTISSREIAELTGKRHDNVIRACKNLNKKYEKLRLPKIGESSYHNSQNKLQPQYLLTRMQTLNLMTRYSTELRIKLNRHWEELEITKGGIDFSDAEQVLVLVQKWAIDQKKKKIEMQQNQTD